MTGRYGQPDWWLRQHRTRDRTHPRKPSGSRARNERILQMYDEGTTQAEIAREYGVTHQRISQIILAFRGK